MTNFCLLLFIFETWNCCGVPFFWWHSFLFAWIEVCCENNEIPTHIFDTDWYPVYLKWHVLETLWGETSGYCTFCKWTCFYNSRNITETGHSFSQKLAFIIERFFFILFYFTWFFKQFVSFIPGLINNK